jgi:YHS domain-containing protein/thiol-disulfide isomerase/thioredoxin
LGIRILSHICLAARLSGVQDSLQQVKTPWSFREMMKHTSVVLRCAAGSLRRNCTAPIVSHVVAGSVFIASLVFASTSMAGDNRSTETWYSSFEKAEQQSKDRGVPILIHFHAHWCGPCRTMDADVLETAEVHAALRAGIVGVKVNADDRQDLVHRFGISSLPTDLIISSDGVTLSRNVGSPGRTAYVSRLAQFSVVENASNGNATNHASETSHAVSVNSIALARATTVPGIIRAERKALRRESKNHVGLHGYSPVSLTESETWRVGWSKFRHEFQGVSYQLSSEEELNRFRANPEKFIPALHGCDPVALVNDQVVQAGHLELGVTWRSKVYFFHSPQTRNQFLSDPERFVRTNNLTFFNGETQG